MREHTYLDELQELSKQRQDGGLIHSGLIHYIQTTLTDDEGFPEGFVLKTAIYGILEEIPKRIPKDLPQQVRVAEEKGEEFTPSSDTLAAINDLNDSLLLPLQGYEVLKIIEKAHEYEERMNSEAPHE